MKKAIALYKSLLDLDLAAAEAKALVESKIEKGEIEDDGFSSFLEKSENGLTAELVKAAAEGLTDLIKGEGTPDISKAGYSKVEKADEDDDAEMDKDDEDEEDMGKSQTGTTGTDQTQVIQILSKSADSILEGTRKANVVIAKALQAQGVLLQDIVKGYNEQKAEVSALREQNATLLKALNLPVIKSQQVQGNVEVQPAPGEQVVKGHEDPAALYQQVADIARNKIMADPENRVLAKSMTDAMTELGTGTHPSVVAQKYGLELK
jgi:hypothetical protein